jgi:hypothetical protein
MVKPYISKIDYGNLAGADWPTYEEYLNNNVDEFIYKEIREHEKSIIPLVPISPPYQQQKDPNISYQYTLQSHPRGKDSAPIYNSCNRPFKAVEIDMFTNCNLCLCTGWLPKPVGKITDFEKLEDIWTNPLAQEIQNDVKTKKYTWCAVEHCGIKYQDMFEPYYNVVFAIDDSCNLQCPSCRREKRMYTSGPLYEEKLRAITHAVELLNKFEDRVHILFNCSGDPLASHLSRPFLQSYVGNNKQTFTLFTNGQLIKKLLPTTTIFERITSYQISIDAGSKEIYEKVRIGGSWELLMENFDFLKEQKLNNKVLLMFTVQKNNYTDILNFENLCKTYGFQGLLTQLDDWGTWISDDIKTPDTWTIKHGTFKQNNVLNKNHSLYQDCKKYIEKTNYVRLSPRLKELLK